MEYVVRQCEPTDLQGRGQPDPDGIISFPPWVVTLLVGSITVALTVAVLVLLPSSVEDTPPVTPATTKPVLPRRYMATGQVWMQEVEAMFNAARPFINTQQWGQALAQLSRAPPEAVMARADEHNRELVAKHIRAYSYVAMEAKGPSDDTIAWAEWSRDHCHTDQCKGASWINLGIMHCRMGNNASALTYDFRNALRLQARPLSKAQIHYNIADTVCWTRPTRTRETWQGTYRRRSTSTSSTMVVQCRKRTSFTSTAP